jgi:hypothetical protein
MASSPGTVSKILWHFTGGPKWNEAEKRQEDHPKPPDDAYTALVEILKSRELRIGGYKEVLKAILPKIQYREPATREIIEESDVAREVISAPVCCLADIPIMHLSYHADRYGKITIGYHRKSAIEHGFNPVFYLLQDSAIIQSLYAAMHAIGAHEERENIEWEGRLFEMANQSPEPIHPSTHTHREALYEVLMVTKELINRVKIAASDLRTVSACIKTYTKSELHTVYCEREWRSTVPFKFGYEDISMIVVPRNANGDEQYANFVAEAQLLGIPRSVPIVAWEDLVEH